MENELKHSVSCLENRPYRYLQQLAKSMQLPSNVKKVYLLELIHAKKYKSESEVNAIIQKVKLERQHTAQVKRNNRRRKVQGTEISSTSRCCSSPPITITPKRSSHILIRCSPDLHQAIVKYNPQTSSHTSFSMPKSNASDRVLRSFNLKSLKKPNYGILNMNNAVIGVIKAQNRSPKGARVKVVNHEGRYPKVHVSGKCMKKHKPSILCSSPGPSSRRQLVLANNRNTSPPLKRQRTLSGIYPLMPLEPIPRRLVTTQGVSLRHTDGRLSRINAHIQKRNWNREKPKPVLDNLQDILNSIDPTDFGVDINMNNNYLQIQYPNMSGISDEPELICNENNIKDIDLQEELSVYYHKKIRAEQMRCQRRNDYVNEEERLPKIHDVFSKFNNVHNRDYSEPLFVHVGDDAEKTQDHLVIPPRNNHQNFNMLETFYNFKNQFLTNAPLLQIATTNNTRCVYSTPTMATAVAQQTSSVYCNDRYNMPSCEVDNHYRVDSDIPRLYEYLKMSDQELAFRRDFGSNDDMNTSASSLCTLQSQSVSTSVTIPEMVEDALELISQDGDYMEQIGMDVRMRCVLCSWAGPKIILENHVRKEHQSDIIKQNSTDWKIIFTLGKLVQCAAWSSQVVEHDAALYVLSAKYDDPDCFMATLSSLSSSDPIQKTGKITVYNKVTGEPFSLEIYIQSLPPNLPYHNDSNCLKLDISSLDLLPNSANLKLLNRELVIKSPTKVVVGQPLLNDIDIVLYVNITDCFSSF